jgi:hypothetical protein
MKLHQFVENFILVNKYMESERYISRQKLKKKNPENFVSRKG